MKREYYAVEVVAWLRIQRQLSDAFFSVSDIRHLLYDSRPHAQVISRICRNLFNEGRIERVFDRKYKYRFLKEQ